MTWFWLFLAVVILVIVRRWPRSAADDVMDDITNGLHD